MKILLLNPPNYEKERHFPYLSREECAIGTVASNFLPSQIYLAANYLRGKGKDVEVLDAISSKISVDGFDLIVVWISFHSSFYKDIEFIKSLKIEDKKTVIVLNDPHEGFEFETMQRFDFIDASIRLWEREIVLDKLITRWEEKRPPDFPGVIYRKKGRLIDTGKMFPLPNIYHLVSSSKILEDAPLERYESACITLGRGCPVGCSFCLYRNTATRKRRVIDVIDEIETVNTSIEKFIMLDPVLPANPNWMNKFCDSLISKKFKISWRTDIRAEQCRLHILNKLKRAGCDTVMMGVETLDADIMYKIKAGTSPEMLKNAINRLKKTGIHLIPIFYLGYPWDSEQTLLKIKKFLRKNPIPSFELTYVKPWKGTLLYEECKKLDILKKELWIDDFINPKLPLFNTLYLTKDELEMWMHEIKESTIMNPRYMFQFLLEKKQIKPKHFKTIFTYLIKEFKKHMKN